MHEAINVHGGTWVALGATLHPGEAMAFEGHRIVTWAFLGPKAIEKTLIHKLARYEPAQMTPWRTPLDRRVMERMARYELDEGRWQLLFQLTDGTMVRIVHSVKLPLMWETLCPERGVIYTAWRHRRRLVVQPLSVPQGS